ncbi:MAG: EutN/CcmL family microcompartment protein [Clostridium sp.]|jgi:ethanolamine utilization protein EutN|nr:EutN/CcmL family microcompartment protein [Clostridium sp.]
MIIGKVVGSVVSTRKNERLIGSKFMIVEPVPARPGFPNPVIAADSIGAGVGEYVLVVFGGAARLGTDMENAPIDAAIVGILDDPEDFR